MYFDPLAEAPSIQGASAIVISGNGVVLLEKSYDICKSNACGNNTDQYDGMVPPAAYSITDLIQTDLKIISIYGSEAGILSMKKNDWGRP